MTASERKLKETEFFLEKLRLALRPAAFSIHNEGHLRLNIRVNAGMETRLPIESDEAEYYLSAFLSAGRSVTFALQAEEKNRYDSIFAGWFNNLTQEQQTLFKQMNEDRIAEVHKLGARKKALDRKIFVKNKSTSDAVISWPEWRFDATNKEILEASKEYVALLNQLLLRIQGEDS
jgi:hypothetical protein